MASSSHVMKVSSNGQVSIPAETRSRWKVERVVMVDMGDHVVMRPLPDDRLEGLRGKYAGAGPSADEMRTLDRDEDAEREDASGRG